MYISYFSTLKSSENTYSACLYLHGSEASQVFWFWKLYLKYTTYAEYSYTHFRKGRMLTSFSFAVEYVYSKRGNPMLLIAGYTFYRQTVYSNSKIRWLCATHHCKGCTATVHTYNKMLLSVRNNHNHQPRMNWCTGRPNTVKSGQM